MKSFELFKQTLKSKLADEYKDTYNYSLAYEEYQDNDCYFELSYLYSYNGNPIVIW